jgi:hypothetical protein
VLTHVVGIHLVVAAGAIHHLDAETPLAMTVVTVQRAPVVVQLVPDQRKASKGGVVDVGQRHGADDGLAALVLSVARLALVRPGQPRVQPIVLSPLSRNLQVTILAQIRG